MVKQIKSAKISWESLGRLHLLVFLLILVALGGFFLARQGFLGQKGAQVTSDLGDKITGGDFQYNEEEKQKAKIPLSALRSGGPPRDGIPPIDNPKFVSLAEGDKFLRSDDFVLGLVWRGEARAYPHRILNWHEIVNDSVASDPILVTYCPLCFTGIAFEPKIDGQVTTFGTSGKLYNSNLVMYDRSSDTLWTQLGGEAIIGKFSGKKLKQIPLTTTTWSQWKEAHGQTLVLSTDTGYSRSYDVNPYEGYETSSDTFGTEFKDRRLKPKDKVWGIEVEGRFKAYWEETLVRLDKITDNFAGKTLLVERFSDGTVKVTDENGQEIVPTIAFWFSWAAFHPETELFN